MTAASLASPASSESTSLSFQQSPFTTRHDINESFRLHSEGSISISDDEFELSLPEDDDYHSFGSSPVAPAPKPARNYYRRSTSSWSSDRLLAIEENVREEAASALLQLRQQAAVLTPVTFHSQFADNLSNIFALANLRLEDAQRKPVVNQNSSALQITLQARHQEFVQEAELSISRFLAEQKRISEEQEAALRKAQEERVRAEEHRIAAARQEAERAERQKQSELAAVEARRKLEKDSAQEEKRIVTTENDTLTLWPLQQVKSVASLRRFCQNRSEMFSQLDAKAKQAPFIPDKQLFLECNEVLNRFVPSADAVPSTVKDIAALLSRAGATLDLHLCNLAVSYTKQVQNKVFQNPNYALGFARLWKSLEAVISRSSLIIMAAFFARCPSAALNLDPPAQEHSLAQTGSLRALLRVFCCFIQRSDNKASDFAWCWLSGVCGSPITVMTAPCLLMFFEVSQVLKFKFLERYGRQGKKLVVFIASDIVPRLPTSSSALSTDVENLRTFFDRTSLRKIPERSYILSCLQNIQ